MHLHSGSTVNLNQYFCEGCHDISLSHATAVITLHYQTETRVGVGSISGALGLEMNQESFFLSVMLIVVSMISGCVFACRRYVLVFVRLDGCGGCRKVLHQVIC